MSFVFQYGSNLSSARLNSSTRLCGDARLVGKAITRENYEFEFDIWSKADGGRAAADIIAGSGRKIWGVIYDIPEHLIRRETSGARKSLDFIEGEGANYERVFIQLDWPDGRPVQESVITYTGLARKTGIQTTWDYAQHIIIGMCEHDMPPEHRKYVIDQMVLNNPVLRECITKFEWPELIFKRHVICPVCRAELLSRRVWTHFLKVHKTDLSLDEILKITSTAKRIPIEKDGVVVKKSPRPKPASTPYSMRGWDAIREGIPRRSGPLGPGKG